MPEEYESIYIESIQNVSSTSEVWTRIDNSFIRLYVYKIWSGNPENQMQADSEGLSKFDFQFLDAIRDVERDMFSGKNTLLKSVIDFFLDYDIKSDKALSSEEQTQKINERRRDFKEKSDILVEVLKKRLENGRNQILSYADHVGASFDNSKPTFEGAISENEVSSILQLLVQQETGMRIPIGNNGLGYNNLIFMSLLLAKMQIDADGTYLGSNAKVFPILAIEEPEAHLHPTMQFQFVKFLKDNLRDKKVRQVFITSHSTHITSSARLDDLICLYKLNNKVKTEQFRALKNWVTSMQCVYKKGKVSFLCDATKSSYPTGTGEKTFKSSNLKILTEHLIDLKKIYWKTGKIHHDDVLFFSVILIEKYPFILEVLRAKFPYIFIDEYQDTSPVQAHIVDKIKED